MCTLGTPTVLPVQYQRATLTEPAIQSLHFDALKNITSLR